MTPPGPPKTDEHRHSAVAAAHHNLVNKGVTTCFKNNIPPEAILTATAMLAGQLSKEGGLGLDEAVDFVRLHMSSMM